MNSKYQKKPVVIEAWIWDESHITLEKIGCGWVAHEGHADRPDECTSLRIQTLEGSMSASKGDYIIKGVEGEFYPCKAEIFHKTYSKVDHLENKE